MGTYGAGQEPDEGHKRIPERDVLRSDWDPEVGVPSQSQELVTEQEPLELSDQASVAVVRGALRGGWHLLRQEPSLVLWSVLTSMLRSVLEALPFLVLLLFVAIEFAELAEGGAPGRWLVDLGQTLLSPTFLVGTGGVFLLASMLSWVVGVAAQTGVLGALTRRVLASPVVVERGLFFRLVGERFATLLGFSLIQGLLRASALALSGGLLWLGASVLRSHGLLEAGASPWGASLVLGGLGMLGGVLVLGVSLLCHLALSHVMLHDRGIFEGLAAAFEDFVTHLAEVIWLYVGVGALFAAAWLAYAPLYVGASVMGSQATLAVPSMVLQLVADGVLGVGLAVAWVWSHGAVLTWVGLRSERIGLVPPMPKARAEGAVPAIVPGLGQGARSAPVSVPQEELSGLLPGSTPNLVSWDEVRRGLVEEDDVG